jgi:putative spermidine/putrescine transport system substrate-binding protein
LFKNGSLANTHFLSIPTTSSNVEGAMVVINYLLSPLSQLEKAKSDVWGDGSVLDISKLDKEMQTKFIKLSSHESLVNTSVLQNNQIPELSASYIEEIERLWVKNVLKK